jgi:octaprenyl-diphosphate synthase
MDLQYIQRIEKIEAVLKEWLPRHPDPGWIRRVFPGLENQLSAECAESLLLPGRELLSRGGKRWRPLLMTLICEYLGGGGAALPLTPLVEFCHNASLIHDDIEDNSDERRGKPAVHLIHGIDAAVNGGCFLYFLPLACIESWTGAEKDPALIWRIWGEYMRRLHLGQAMDIHWHRDFSSLPSIGEYYVMCGLKTGCLARLAAVLGVYAVPGLTKDRKEPAAGAFGDAAEKLGVGFQILDDVKNLRGGISGKKRGDDVVEGKKSLPVLLYLHRRPDRREFAARCFNAARTGGAGVPEVEAFAAELEAAGALQEAEEKGLSLIGESRKFFSAPPEYPGAGGAGTEAGELLAGFADLVS